MKPRYYVLTLDHEKTAFTPQRGVRKGPYTLFGLRKALRKLQAGGYPCNRDDPSVLVYRETSAAERKADKEASRWLDQSELELETPLSKGPQ